MSDILEKIAQWVKEGGNSPDSTKRDTRAEFIAVQADVKVAIDAGYAYRTIWEHMRETKRLSCRYETFLRYVRKFIQPMRFAPKLGQKGAPETGRR